MTTETKDIEKAKSNLPVVDIDSAWGAGDEDEQRDLLIPKIYHQQALSKGVSDGKAAAGDWLDSIMNKVICKKDEVLQVIIFQSYRNLLISKWNVQTNQFEWVRTESVTPENSDYQFEYEEGGEKFRCQIQYNYFCLLATRPEEFPFVLSMSSTKTMAARKLNMMFKKLKSINRSTASVVFEFKTIKEQGPKGSWFGVEISQGRDATKEEKQIALNYFNKLKTTKYTVADVQEMDVASDTPGAPGGTSGEFADDDVPF